MKREAQRAGVFTRRALIVGGVQIAALGALATKLYHVQVVEGARYATLAESNRISARLLAPPRGRLLDRTGVVVAGNRLNWRALLIAEQTTDVAATLDHFGTVVPFADHDRARVERELRRHRRFIPVILREFLTWEEMARVEVHAPELPGVLVDVGTTREYHFGSTLAHIVGYVAPPAEQDAADDPVLALPGMRVGRAGMERQHDAVLRGRAGAVQLEVNAQGRVIRELDRHEGVPGADVQLTIDAELQQTVLGKLGEESASAVVLDISNGDVLAMASNPSFDPSVFNSGVSQAQWVEWTSNRRAPLINKAVAGIYSPGSTFKTVVALAALDAKVIAPGETVNCPGYLDYGDRRYHCWSKGGHGNVDMRTAIKFSCDVYFFESARRMGIDRLAAMANRFGIGVDLGSDLPGARTGLMPTKQWAAGRGEAWNIGDTIVCGIGQGRVQTTPLALATLAARIASGRQIVPRLTSGPSSLADSLGVPERGLALVRDGMWAVVNEQSGSAPLAKLGPIASPIYANAQMAGKTGSVQVRNVTREQREKGYKSDNLAWEFRPHALFIAYAPYDAPRYALALVVEHGNAGAQAAAPIAREIMIETLLRDPAGPKKSTAQARI